MKKILDTITIKEDLIMGRKYVNWVDGLATMGGSKRKPKENDKLAAQRKKFTKCKVCGGKMTYVADTNIFICENVVEKTKKIKLEDGNFVEKKVTEPCGNTNLISNAYMGYINYLFN